MKTKILPLITILTLACLPTLAHAKHQCDADALQRSAKLIVFHGEPAEHQGYDISPTVSVKPRLKALNGNGYYEVLETTGYIYKASFRMRFLYAKIPGQACILMGQEIIESSGI